MALKRCNNRRVRELWWGVFTPAAQSTSSRSSFQTRLTSPIPGGRSTSPAVALRDVLCVCLSLSLNLPLAVDRAICTPCIRMTVWLTLFFVSSPFGNVTGQLSEWFLSVCAANTVLLEDKDNMTMVYCIFCRHTENKVIKSYRPCLQ